VAFPERHIGEAGGTPRFFWLSSLSLLDLGYFITETTGTMNK
jgi:hypothetical protein